VLAQQPLLANAALADPDSRLVATAFSSNPGSIPPLDFVREALRQDKPVLSDVFNTPSRGTPAAVLAFPVHAASGSVVGVLGLQLNLNHLQELFSGIPLPRSSVVTVTDRNGRILVRSLDPAKYVGMVGAAAATPERPYVRDLDGVDRLAADAMLHRAPWRVSVGIPLSEVIARVAAIWIRNIALVLVVTLSTVLVSVWVAFRTTGGLENLRTAAQRITAGDLTAAEPIPMPNLELEQLQDAFTTMSTRLREARDANERQMAEERRLNEMLRSMQRQVVRQERQAAVGLLLSGVAHEVNNPLQAILGSTQLLARQDGLSPAAKEEIDFIQSQAIRARRIIRSLSRFSDHQPGPAVHLDLREVVNEVLALKAEEFEREQVRVSVAAPVECPVNANFTELARVVFNLVANAQQSLLAARTPSPRIDVRLLVHDGHVRCEVHDNGPGVPASDEPKLFQPFFTTRTVGEGTGLGLSVSYGIVQSYGGAIGYARNQAGGATFYFELPLHTPDQNDQYPAPVLQPPGHTGV
jgi:two-component system NtrC family sensor kinase